MTGEETGMEEMHARRIGAFTREDRGKREEIERREKRKGQRGEIGEKTTYINDMMNGGRGLSTIPNRHRNAQELQGDCPAAGDREGGGGKRGAAHLTVRRPHDEPTESRESLVPFRDLGDGRGKRYSGKANNFVIFRMEKKERKIEKKKTGNNWKIGI